MVRRVDRRRPQMCRVRMSEEAVAGLAKEGAVGAASLAEFVKKLSKLARSGSWFQRPSSTSRSLISALLEKGDILIDGGQFVLH